MGTVIAIQKQLAELGLDPGPVDGVRGRLTIRAIKEFQREHGLAVDGLIGPATLGLLFGGTGSAPSNADLPWYEEARRLMGTKEIEGRNSNPTILDWASPLNLDYRSDDIPWCGLFVAHCIAATLPDEPLPNGPLSARNWRRFGRACEPTMGAVLVFWRTDRLRSPNGHVGFYAGEDEASFYVLGGNQSDSVSIARLKKDRILDVRFPATVPFGEKRTVRYRPSTDPFSTNEA